MMEWGGGGHHHRFQRKRRDSGGDPLVQMFFAKTGCLRFPLQTLIFSPSGHCHSHQGTEPPPITFPPLRERWGGGGGASKQRLRSLIQEINKDTDRAPPVPGPAMEGSRLVSGNHSGASNVPSLSAPFPHCIFQQDSCHYRPSHVRRKSFITAALPTPKPCGPSAPVLSTK